MLWLVSGQVFLVSFLIGELFLDDVGTFSLVGVAMIGIGALAGAFGGFVVVGQMILQDEVCVRI